MTVGPPTPVVVSPKVTLGFSDGNEIEVDPASRDGQALSEIAKVLAARDQR